MLKYNKLGKTQISGGLKLNGRQYTPEQFLSSLEKTYLKNKIYCQNDLVFYDNKIFISLQDNNTGNQPTQQSLFWKILVGQTLQPSFQFSEENLENNKLVIDTIFCATHIIDDVGNQYIIDNYMIKYDIDNKKIQINLQSIKHFREIDQITGTWRVIFSGIY